MRWLHLGLVGTFLLTITGCENLPGTRKQQGATMGGLGGAAVGAAVGGNHKLLGALIGGALGAGGGYVVAAKTDHINNNDTQAAQTAAQRAEQTPATAQDALQATSADINRDGFVTMDEVVALKRAGLSDETMLARLRSTGQVFELTDDQRRFLNSQGVSSYVVNNMATLNQDRYQAPYNSGAYNQNGAYNRNGTYNPNGYNNGAYNNTSGYNTQGGLVISQPR
ncbi:MAG TPA: hypothetical protein VMZ27_06455 [Candidatus Saccharimonadales bacterium]|nr:hypothetical protein [Candidatus Saccharimonadales bacterium]